MFGPWPPLAGDSDAGATPLCIAAFRLGTGTEALDAQFGEEVFAGVNVVGTGEYELTLDPAFEAIITDSTALFMVATAGDFVPRIVVVFPTLPTIALNVYDADGAHQPIGRVWIALYYNTGATPT